jgi:hypothetical protein
VDKLKELDRAKALALLSKHEQEGTLFDFISKIAPEYIFNGEVEKFRLLKDLG